MNTSLVHAAAGAAAAAIPQLLAQSPSDMSLPHHPL